MTAKYEVNDSIFVCLFVKIAKNCPIHYEKRSKHDNVPELGNVIDHILT